MFGSTLIACRGEAAARVIRTARSLSMRTIAVHAPDDRDALHVRLADEAYELRPRHAPKGYRDIAGVIAVALRAGAECIHPGYGFLAANALFAEACEWSGAPFIGPPHETIRLLQRADRARALAADAGAPVIPGYAGEDQSPERLAEEAQRLGYPVLIRAAAGRPAGGPAVVAAQPKAFAEALARIRLAAEAAFGDGAVIVERLIQRPRHIEVQAFADRHGGLTHLFERDCSLRRRRRTVMGEAPAPDLPEGLRARMTDAALQIARAAGLVGAGTVGFLTAGDRLTDATPFHFLEMKTGLDAGCATTELVTGVDLVAWQFRVAAGEPLPLRQEDIALSGVAIGARVRAEDPAGGFRRATGKLWALRLPETEGVRVDAGAAEGDVVAAGHGGALAGITARGEDREEALRRLRAALRGAVVAGPRCNIAFLHRLASHVSVAGGGVDVGFIAAMAERLARREPDPAAVFEGAKALLDRARRRIEERRGAAPGEDPSPWSVADAFTLGGSRTLTLDVLADGVPRSVVLTWRGGALEQPPDDGVSALLPPAQVFEAGDGSGGADAVIVWRNFDQTVVAPVSPGAEEEGAGSAGGGEV